MNASGVEPAVPTHGGIIALLEEVQAKHGFLPEDKLRQIASETGRSLVDVYGVATFYRAFSLKPRGRHVVSCCLGTACHVQGGPRIAEAFTQELGIRAGETTPDREFSLEMVNCLGACALGPVVVVDGHYSSKVRTSQVKDIVERARSDKVASDHEIPDDEIVNMFCPHCHAELIGGGHCADCGAPMVPMIIRGGGVVQICSRRGCRGHMLDVGGVPLE